jgi:hypothetical protein
VARGTDSYTYHSIQTSYLKNSLIYGNFLPLTEILHFSAIMVTGGEGVGTQRWSCKYVK